MNVGKIQFKVGLLASVAMTISAMPAHGAPLDEILVTAQRRTQSVQDVPIAITAYDAEGIEKAGIVSVEDYFATTPNVYITSGATRNADQVSGSSLGLSIRGVSNIGGNASSFGIYQDDFNISAITRNPHLMDMERIEVLRGPQGTYFGRNASGGVMSLSTAKPNTDSFSGKAELGYASFNTFEANGHINAPLSENIAFRLAGKLENSDGAYKNAHPSGDGNGFDYKSLRASVRATPSDALTLDLSYTYTDEHDDDFGLIHTGIISDFISGICPGPNVACPTDVNLGFYPNNRDTYSHDAPLVSDNEYHLVTAKAEYETDFATFTSVTGYGSAKFNRSGELDFSSADFLREPSNPNTRKSFSQELRLASNGSGPLSWIVGGVYAEDKHEEAETIAFGSQNDFGLPAGFRIEFGDFRQKIKSTALFAELGYEFTDRLSVNFSGRYSHDKITRDETQLEFEGPLAAVAGENTFSDFAPRFALNYMASDDVNLYATVSKGWKSGGFNLDPQRARSDFGDETLWNYEAGVKSDLFDGRMRANLSVFHIDWKDVQVASTVIGQDNNGNIINFSGISNAATATSTGVELELTAAVSDNIETGLNLGYMDAKFKDFKNALIGGVNRDLSGQPLPKAPDLTLSLYGQYTHDFSNEWEGFVRGEFNYTADNYSSVNNIVAVMDGAPQVPFLTESYGVANLRVGISNDVYAISAYVENLFDAEYYTSTYDFGFVNGAAVVPSYRFMGVRASRTF